MNQNKRIEIFFKDSAIITFKDVYTFSVNKEANVIRFKVRKYSQAIRSYIDETYSFNLNNIAGYAVKTIDKGEN